MSIKGSTLPDMSPCPLYLQALCMVHRGIKYVLTSVQQQKENGAANLKTTIQNTAIT